MQWKKTAAFFGYQLVRYARSWSDFSNNKKYYRAWKASQAAGRNSVADEWAWINFAALDYLSGWLRPEHRVFEFGGGGSTLFFSKKCGFVATVEHDPTWFDILEKKMNTLSRTNWEGYSVPGEPVVDLTKSRSVADPKDYASASAGYENQNFERYATTIRRYAEQSFDLVLVDGRARPACIAESLPYLKSGGLLVLDNAERERYWTAFRDIFEHDFEVILDRQGPVPYSPDFTITLLLRKR
jgi:hypothetical protein